MRVTVPSALATQTVPGVVAIEVGRDDSASGVARVTPVPASRCVTDAVSALATQTPESPTATATGPAATGTVTVTLPASASMRDTVLSVAFTTQIASVVAASAN